MNDKPTNKFVIEQRDVYNKDKAPASHRLKGLRMQKRTAENKKV
jgi:hypothetical protein